MPWQWHSSICMVLDFFLPRYFGAFGFSPSGFLYIDQVSFLEFWASCSYPQVLATWPPVLLPYSCQPTEILFSTLRGCWGGLGEGSTMLWLLIKGAKDQPLEDPA